MLQTTSNPLCNGGSEWKYIFPEYENYTLQTFISSGFHLWCGGYLTNTLQIKISNEKDEDEDITSFPHLFDDLTWLFKKKFLLPQFCDWEDRNDLSEKGMFTC